MLLLNLDRVNMRKMVELACMPLVVGSLLEKVKREKEKKRSQAITSLISKDHPQMMELSD